MTDAQNYRVAYGWCREDWKYFATFADALAFYREHEHDESYGPSMSGPGADDESDGLTEEEREQLS